MNARALSKLSLILSVVFLLSACSSVKIASIEKRRYLDGYHLSTKHHKNIKEDLNHELLRLEEEAKQVDGKPGADIPKQKKQVKSKEKMVKSFLKNLKKEHSFEAFLVSLDDGVNQVAIPHARKNLASVRQKERALSPDASNELDISLFNILLLLVLYVISALLVGPLFAILLALLLTFLIIRLLKGFDVIDS